MRLLIAWFGLVFITVSLSHAQLPSESDVKAALVFNFIKFVEWSAERTSGETFHICLLGEQTALMVALAAFDRKTAQNRELRVRHVSRGTAMPNCHVLVFGESEASSAHGLLHSLQKQGLLTISDIEGFADFGGIIGLQVMDQKVRFAINVEAAREANLKVSSQLLKLAHSVVGKP